jgi:hypothetical protein
MTLSKLIRCAMLLAGFFTISQTAFAQGQVIDNDTTTAELSMSANAQTVLSLAISTNGGATVSANAPGEFSINLGDVNGLGVGTPATGVSVAAGSSGATYTTPITLTPTFSGFSSANATITVERSATGGNSLGDDAVREGAAANSVDTVDGTAVEVTATATTTTPITRYVGFFVSKANGTGYVSGSLASTLVYTITATP